jgi:formylglycine-generating enzyme required for sulfatase activity
VSDDHPVGVVSWNDATEFCQWLSAREGRLYRLPTEAEWECACRAGTRTRWYFGDDPGDMIRFGNIENRRSKVAKGEANEAAAYPDNGFAFTAPVGSFLPNPWGLYDMHGNVWEHCQDDWLPYTAWKTRVDPVNAVQNSTLHFRIFRGGSNTSVEGCESARRNFDKQGAASAFVGFRVACEFPPD